LSLDTGIDLFNANDYYQQSVFSKKEPGTRTYP
jgi:hypothetical protein